jgi:hypothetical protein
MYFQLIFYVKITKENDNLKVGTSSMWLSGIYM